MDLREQAVELSRQERERDGLGVVGGVFHHVSVHLIWPDWTGFLEKAVYE